MIDWLNFGVLSRSRERERGVRRMVDRNREMEKDLCWETPKKVEEVCEREQGRIEP